MKQGSGPGRSALYTISREKSGPTASLSSCSFNSMGSIEYHKACKKCTETEAQRVLKSEWRVISAELYAFIAILYRRGAYEARSLSISYL